MNSIQMPATRTAPATVHPAFEWVRSEPIVALGAVVEEYRHRVTGAQHFHIATDNPENVFLVALRTVPEDSITIVDNLVRCLPLLCERVIALQKAGPVAWAKALSLYRHDRVLKVAERQVRMARAQ